MRVLRPNFIEKQLNHCFSWKLKRAAELGVNSRRVCTKDPLTILINAALSSNHNEGHWFTHILFHSVVLCVILCQVNSQCG